MTESEKIAITKDDLMYESRLAKVEAISSNLAETTREIKEELKAIKSEMKSDFRWLSVLILLLAGLMAKGFHWIG